MVWLDDDLMKRRERVEMFGSGGELRLIFFLFFNLY